MTDMSMSPLDAGASDDLLAALDEMLAFTPEAASSTNPLAQMPLDATYHVSDAFEFPEVPSPTTSSTTRTARKRCPRGPYQKPTPRRRKRPKDELDYLRAKVTDLEEELTNLNQSAGRLSPTSDDDEEMFARWKQVAERQKEEANRTVVENLKLRAMLQGQLEIARRLEAAISEHQQEAAAQAFPWNPVKFETDVEEDDTSVDALLESSGIADVQHEKLSNIQLKQDLNGISFGHKEVRLLPFTMQAVARVMWSFLLYESSKMPGSIQTRVVNNDHLNATIVDTLQLPKSRRTEVFTRMAVRRYFEENRVVMVWSGCVEIAGSVSGSPTPEGCILRAVVDVKPETVEFSAGAESQGHIGEMTDLVLGTYHRNLGMLNQVMENLLLNELMGEAA
ncbi:hypothetical protein PRIC1_001867 [Phytophthora ramorum]